ncbi:hypothetical protein PCH_Pc22g19210 [Penicillium rubens Wisconsin 54-1255]|uniref:Uncharacterized protein n=1 Tax=Penicillium rubens (strain ATCC 28089 / DSM 1075 / NRRL 1951 / Wisconsin 54-1255) TaxID=500485 RepID=B6HVQ4_PENRW|nr:hypothetical protein PCH_Pc22g19210 [Penicillium rubens Wisconsin 54-1255]
MPSRFVTKIKRKDGLNEALRITISFTDVPKNELRDYGTYANLLFFPPFPAKIERDTVGVRNTLSTNPFYINLNIYTWANIPLIFARSERRPYSTGTARTMDEMFMLARIYCSVCGAYNHCKDAPRLPQIPAAEDKLGLVNEAGFNTHTIL